MMLKVAQPKDSKGLGREVGERRGEKITILHREGRRSYLCLDRSLQVDLQHGKYSFTCQSQDLSDNHFVCSLTKAQRGESHDHIKKVICKS